MVQPSGLQHQTVKHDKTWPAVVFAFPRAVRSAHHARDTKQLRLRLGLTPRLDPTPLGSHCGNVECLVALLNAGAATAGFSFTAGFKNKAVPRAGHVAKKPSLEHPTCTGHAGEQRPHPQGCCSTRAGLQSFRMSQRLSPRFDPATLGGQSRTDRVPGDPSERRRCRGMAGDLSVVACCGLGHTSPRSESVMTHIKN